MRIANHSLLFLCFLLLIACDSKDKNTMPVISTPTPSGIDTIIPNGNERYLNEKSDYLFDQDKLPTFELTLPAASLATLDADPAAEQYVAGSLTFEGETISPVGIRYKGSIGAFVGCVSGSDWNNPSGYKTCTKLSLKIKINWNDSDDQFYGLKKIQLHSQNLDPSQMRERLGYWLFRQMGVPAPRSVHARVIINGTYAGLYAFTEQIDGRFTRQNFENGKGNLYKEIWPVDMNGQAYPASEYLRHLKTNEDENPSVDLIHNFGTAIANSNSSNIQTVITDWMDIQKVLAYAVVDRTIRLDDGAFHWYCNQGICTNHNYYWYEDPEQKKLHLIPWDLDNAFENIIYDQNPVTPIADEWGATRANCAPFSYGQLRFQQRSAACDKLTAGWANFTSEYENLKTQLIEGPLSAAAVDPLLDAWSMQIREATMEASQAHEDAIPLGNWETALLTLKSQLEFARTH